MRVIRAADLPVTLWKNGAGRKADIAAGEGWMIGYAWLDQDAPFSDFTGHDRTITLVEGPGFALVTPDGVALVRLDALFQPAAFDGGAAVTCRMDGPCRVLNVMTARAGFQHEIQMRGAGPHRFAAAGPDAGRFLVVLQGEVVVGGAQRLARFDAMAMDAAGACAGGAGAVMAVISIYRGATAGDAKRLIPPAG